MAFQLRTLIAPLLLGGTLIATSLPAMADHDHRRYGSPKVEYHYHDHRGGKHQYHRGKPKHVKKHHKHQKHVRVVEHHHYHAPPRARYYEPGVVVTVPPIIFKLN